MSTPIVAFFNPQGGVGTTSLVYHLAWMYQGLGLKVLAIDLDPQAGLTTMLLTNERLAEIWTDNNQLNNVTRYLQILREEESTYPSLELIEDGFNLLTGDLSLSELEDEFSLAWQKHSDSKHQKSPSVVFLFRQLFQQLATSTEADIVLLDLGSNLGAINRSAILASNYLITPLSLDLTSIQGLRYLQSALSRWQSAEETAVIQPLGYVVQQQNSSFIRPPNHQSWQAQVDRIYGNIKVTTSQQSNCLALFNNYQGLLPMALSSQKAMFQLKPADGAIGTYSRAVREVYEDYRQLAQKIAQLTQIANWPDQANYSRNYLTAQEYKTVPDSLPLYILEKGFQIFRIHTVQRPALYFNRNSNSRFSSFIQNYGVLYAGLDPFVAFREIFNLKSLRLIDQESLERMCLSCFWLQRDLKLIDISGPGLTMIGADSRIITGSNFPLSQSWSQTLYEHRANVDGLYYRSCYDPSRFCVALYENRVRLEDLQEQRITQNNLLDESFAAMLQQILDEYQYQLGDNL
jgi:chromosome partitioning protein